MLRAFRRSRELGSTATVVIGADSPTLPAARIELAFQHLADGVPLVLAPSVDGGYVLIGLREPEPELFAEIPWSSSDVERITRRRAADAGLHCELLDAGFDVDDAEGLRRLREDLTGPAAKQAPATARWLLDAGANLMI